MKVFLIILLLLGMTETLMAEESFVYEDHGKRDPFWRLVNNSGAMVNYETEVLLSDMVLEGIISGANGDNLAIINHVIVKSNDKFGLFVVGRIDRDTVLLTKGQESFELKLKKKED